MRNFANHELVPLAIAHRSWAFNRTKNRDMGCAETGDLSEG